MPVYRLEIERGDTLWVTAHDERGAIEMASAHLGEEPALEKTMVQLKHDADDALILRAMAGQWPPASANRSPRRQLHQRLRSQRPSKFGLVANSGEGAYLG